MVKTIKIMKIKNSLKKIGTTALVLFLALSSYAGGPENLKNTDMEKFDTHEFPALPYGYDALEPYIDARTMEIHYDKHHRAYFNNFVGAIKDTKYDNSSIYEIFSKVSEAGDVIRNNGGGFYNHVFFWNILSAKSSGPAAELTEALVKEFGSLDKFREVFSNAAKTRFGSGWAWLVVTAEGKLAVGSTPNQDNPLMDVSPVKGTPLLALDVWEHAYYLKYQNRRPEYVEAFWKVVNWEEVSRRYKEAKK